MTLLNLSRLENFFSMMSRFHGPRDHEACASCSIPGVWILQSPHRRSPLQDQARPGQHHPVNHHASKQPCGHIKRRGARLEQRQSWWSAKKKNLGSTSASSCVQKKKKRRGVSKHSALADRCQGVQRDCPVPLKHTLRGHVDCKRSVHDAAEHAPRLDVDISMSSKLPLRKLPPCVWPYWACVSRAVFMSCTSEVCFLRPSLCLS